MIKNSIKPIFTFLTCLIIGTVSFGQSIHFSFTNGAQADYNLVDVQKITFTDDVMNFQLNDGTTYSWNVSTIGQYQYYETIVSIDKVLVEANQTEVNIFPNPSNGTINICYTLKWSEHVKIEWYDITGKLLEIVFEGEQQVGKQYINWQAECFQSGSYICRISSPSFTIRKVILLNK
jgi:hypothetical protein